MKRALLFLCLLVGFSAKSQMLRIAVAANAQFVIKALTADFNTRTGLKTEVIIGSSGKLAAQIKNGAPFDFFLSADMDFPARLYNEGFAITPAKAYALGNLIVCSGSVDLKNWQKVVQSTQVRKIAIANPELAPYGEAAVQALKKGNLWNKIKSKMIIAESIAQVNTYITTGAVDVGFTTEAFIREGHGNLKWSKVDARTYNKMEQGMVILSHAKKRNYAIALKFYNYLQSAPAKKILLRSGYQIP